MYLHVQVENISLTFLHLARFRFTFRPTLNVFSFTYIQIVTLVIIIIIINSINNDKG